MKLIGVESESRKRSFSWLRKAEIDVSVSAGVTSQLTCTEAP
jgi:hypothetical protein